jgi:D-alanyl-D-alanine carboxypeptidase (penicillin-binding protein 5/6)
VVVYATLLGSPSRSLRNTDLASLLVWGQSQFRDVPLVQTGRVYARVALPYGEQDLALVAARPLHAATRIDRVLHERVVAARSISLPVRRGAVLGRVEVWSNGRLVGTRDLVASRSVERPGLIRRLGWYAGRTAHHLAHLLQP